MEENMSAQKPIKHGYGFGLRLSFAIFVTVIAAALLIPGIAFLALSASEFASDGEWFLRFGSMFLGVGSGLAAVAAFGYVGAVKGRTARWANILSIIAGAVLFFSIFGILAVIGGVKGIRVIDHPETEDGIPKFAGYGQRLAFAIVMTILTLIFILAGAVNVALGSPEFAVFVYVGIATAAVAALGYVGAVKGKTSNGANILSVVVGVPLCVVLVGILAVVGGIKGKNAIWDGSAAAAERIRKSNKQKRKEYRNAAKPINNGTNADDGIVKAGDSEPDFDGTGVGRTVKIENGEAFITALRVVSGSSEFHPIEFVTVDDDIPLTSTCIGAAVVDRYGKNRLYIAYRYVNDDTATLYASYVVQRIGGEFALAEERDDGMVEKFGRILSGIGESAGKGKSAEIKRYKTPWWGWLIAIVLIPISFVWQFIKTLLSLFGIAMGDSPFFKALKGGGNSRGKKYTFINDMGCEETVYSNDGKIFYRSDGSCAGTSSDGGKTIEFE